MWSGHSLLNKKGKKVILGTSFVAFSCEDLKSSPLSSFHGYLHHLPHPTLSTMYELCSSIQSMKSSPLSLLLLYACLSCSFSFFLVWWSTIFIGSCGFKSKLPHSLFKPIKSVKGPSQLIEEVFGVCAQALHWSLKLPCGLDKCMHWSERECE